MNDKIEIPAVELLDRERGVVNQFKSLARMLGHYSIGWSYLLEWAWIFGQVEVATFEHQTVLDAGAGLGLSQWYLAEQGAQVYSVDRLSRACLPAYLRQRYDVTGLRESDLLPVRAFLNPFSAAVGVSDKARGMLRSFKGVFARLLPGRAPGKVIIYNQDLADLADIHDNSVDLVVSTSSLEHNTPENLPRVVAELVRVLKPGGKLIATLAAAKERDWYHAPSYSWCYTDTTLMKLFDLDPQTSSNYAKFDELMQSTRDCRELRSGLSYHYFLSGRNGMPWGRWNPVYLPVGVVKVKR